VYGKNNRFVSLPAFDLQDTNIIYYIGSNNVVIMLTNRVDLGPGHWDIVPSSLSPLDFSIFEAPARFPIVSQSAAPLAVPNVVPTLPTKPKSGRLRKKRIASSTISPNLQNSSSLSNNTNNLVEIPSLVSSMEDSMVSTTLTLPYDQNLNNLKLTLREKINKILADASVIELTEAQAGCVAWSSLRRFRLSSSSAEAFWKALS
jgi:hypothetical protein